MADARKVVVQLGEESYRIVVEGEDEGDMAEYGEQAILDLDDAHYLCLIDDADTEPDQVEVTVRHAGQNDYVAVDDVEVVEAKFDGFSFDDEDEEEDDDSGDDEDEDEEEDEDEVDVTNEVTA